MRGGALFKGKEGRGDFRKTPSLMLKKVGMILEQMKEQTQYHYE